MSNINFHQTFPPTLEYLTRLLEITDMTDEKSKEEISAITGIPTGKSSGKVEPHIHYATYMGLIINKSNEKGKYALACTPLGNLIKREDLGLHEEISQLLCHFRLTSISTGAIMWSTIIRNILPRYPKGISTLLLEDELKKNNSFSTCKIKTGPFFSCYSNSFNAFNFIEKRNDYIKLIPQVYKNELLYVYAYALLYEWEQVYPDTNEISSQQIKALMIGEAFGLNDEAVNQIFIRLEEKSIIKINGQLSPFIVIKMKSLESILGLIFGLLC